MISLEIMNKSLKISLNVSFAIVLLVWIIVTPIMNADGFYTACIFNLEMMVIFIVLVYP